MIRLALDGPSTLLTSPLCARCPSGPAGCCASPPGVEWSDLGRIVALGGVEWLLSELGAGRLRPGPRGLLMLRAEPTADGSFPRRCVYHGPAGCTIPHDRRAATCNYYICDDAFADAGEPSATRGREVHDTLVALLGGWDRDLAEQVRARHPDGPPWDAAFFAWLGEAYALLVARSRKRLRALSL